MNTRFVFRFLRFALGLVLLCCLVFRDVSPASADPLRCYVKADVTGGDGTSWLTAYDNLQAALGTSPCTEVWVAAGTYKPTSGSSTDRAISFELKNGVALYGGFAGGETLLSQRDPAANLTILSGEIGDPGVTTDNSYHVLVGSGTDSTALLDGFTVTAGNADGTGDGKSGAGGGMFNSTGSPSLSNVIFSGNSAADGGGGGMFNYNSSNPSLTEVIFSGNSAGESGGGLNNNYYSSPNLTNVTFSNNTAYHGGGMENGVGSSPSLTNVTFNGNSATLRGGGGSNDSGSSPSFTNVNFIGNSSGQDGGGMYNTSGSNPSLTNVTFHGNVASSAGGGIYNWQSSPILERVTFSGNEADWGGGMANYDSSSPSLTNVTISENSATSYGGGMYNVYSSSPTLLNVTIGGNTATVSGGGMADWSNSSPSITNSILYGDAGGEIDGPATVTYSIVQGGYTGTGNLNANPLLGPLQYNGGFTQTMALGPESQAIDKGTNSGCPLEDQRSIARPQDGDGNGLAVCDMGAYEAPGKLSLFSTGAKDGWVLESTETSGVGGMMNASQATFALGDDAADRQGRSILSFNTAGLPDTAVIASATLRIRYAGVVGTNPFRTHGNVLVDMRRGAFSNNAALQLQDFQAAAHKNGALTIKNNPVDGWYTGVMAAANLRYINKGGVTQFRLRFTKDDNDDLGLDYIKFYSGNCTTAANRPQLIIRYYVP